jgi:hypothetical protein
MTVKTKSGLSFEFAKTSDKRVRAFDSLLANG